ncbi:MAG: hypothetical protein FJX78_04765 [Armatimonadetes bacterium]|nr:hypothetical protein [Armatimonadota bacterium]
MALVLSFPCGRCGKLYAVYYPKSIVYQMNGQGTRDQGEREDASERADGAIDAARRRAESQGRTWISAADQAVIHCACGKALNLDLNAHPRVPQTRPSGQSRQLGTIALPDKPKKH